MRVLIVSNLFPPAFIGGYELAAQDVATMLAARGHSVSVLSSGALDGHPDPATPYTLLRTLECLVAQVEVIAPEDTFHRGFGLNLRNLAALAEAVASSQAEVILCFNIAGLGPLGLLKLFATAGPPAVLMLMDNPFVFGERDPALAQRLRDLLGLPAGLPGVTALSCSESLTREISAITGKMLALPVIPAWTTTTAPPPRAHDGPARFVFASRIAPHKGMMLVVEAAALLQARGETAFTVDVWGAGSPAEMMQTAHAAGVGPLFRYRGMTTKQAMVGHFTAYDALLFPSWEREPSGFVPIEAAVAGCIPIITGTIGSAEFLLDGLHCLKIRRTAEDLAAAMLQVARMPAPDRLALRTRVRRHARRMFDAERWFDVFEAVLHKAISQDRRTVVPVADAVLALTALAHIWRSTDG